jgi:plasmid replication initiation protein
MSNEIIEVTAAERLEKENWVTMSHIASRHAQGLSLRVKRLLALAISRNHYKKPAKGASYNQLKVRITAQEYSDAFDVDMKTAYGDLKDASDNLFERYLRYEVMTPKGLKERKLRWVEEVEYHHGEGWVSFTFTSAITPHLYQLEEKFTTYKLKQAGALRSIYSWRLLEIFASWRDKPSCKITIDELIKALEIPKSYAYINIRQRCIDPAIKELREKDNLIVSWEPIKKGRKVIALKFTWSQDPQGRLPL